VQAARAPREPRYVRAGVGGGGGGGWGGGGVAVVVYF
jgi:hypothetical protein